MAELLGLDRSYLSEIETGKKDPSLRELETFADGFSATWQDSSNGLWLGLEALDVDPGPKNPPIQPSRKYLVKPLIVVLDT